MPKRKSQNVRNSREISRKLLRSTIMCECSWMVIGLDLDTQSGPSIGVCLLFVCFLFSSNTFEACISLSLRWPKPTHGHTEHKLHIFLRLYNSELMFYSSLIDSAQHRFFILTMRISVTARRIRGTPFAKNRNNSNRLEWNSHNISHVFVFVLI